MSFKKTQWNLYKVDTIGARQKCPPYNDVCVIESLSENQKSLKVNMKSNLCHDFPSPDLLEGPKDAWNSNNPMDKFHSLGWRKQSHTIH